MTPEHRRTAALAVFVVALVLVVSVVSGGVGTVAASGSVGTVAASGSVGTVATSGSVGTVATSGSVATAAASGSVGSNATAETVGAASEPRPTYVQDNVTSDTTWSPDDGPYFVSTDVTIEPDATLTIDPGTTVNVAEEVTLTVEGTLLASGTAENPVEITTAAQAPSAGTWQTIEYAGGPDSTLRLDHTLVEYGMTGVTATSGKGTIEITDSTIRDHVRTGMALQNREGAPNVDIADSRFVDLGTAGVEVAVPATNPYVESVSSLSVRRSTFERTGSHGVQVRAREISDVTIADVEVSGVDREGVLFATESTDARPRTTNNHVASDVRLRDVRVNDAGASGIAFQGGELSRVDVLRSNVANTAGAGIEVRDAIDADAVRFTGNTVTDSGSGVRVHLQQPQGSIQRVSLALAANHLARNDRAGIDADLAHVVVESVDVTNNTIEDNGDDGIRLRTQRVASTAVTGNVVRGNDDRGVHVAGRHVTGLSVSRNRITQNGNDGVAVRAGETLAGLAVTHNSLLDNDGFGVDADGSRSGSAANELRENTVVANVDGVRVASPMTTVLANNSVAFNSAAHERPGAAPSERTATGVLVENTTGNVTLEHNDIYGHLTGLRTVEDSDVDVDAEDNYWGAESGPYHATLNPDGAGDSVVTDRGRADPVPFASEPFGPSFERPTAVLDANETTVAPGDSVAFSGAQSRGDGTITDYYFTVDGDSVTGTDSSTHVTSFAEPGTYEVTLAVEDDLGVRSLNDASVSVTVRASNETTTPGETTTGEGTTTAPTTTTPGGPGDDQSGDRSIVDSLRSGWGGLGGLFYALALVLGVYGTVLSIRGRRPPIRGRTIHVLAAFGVVTWLVAGVLVDGNLLTVAGAGAVAWGAMTGVVLALAS